MNRQTFIFSIVDVLNASDDAWSSYPCMRKPRRCVALVMQ
ncbi:hypothetical protein HMPREF0758_0274 [Serratia odorifera DSM 4582]|uniref:Uncharacterized protein n=1 Tax=Serratia odorifera DSM 4582 TaxID=667129 RepID=D4DWH4_SEROD|nr:hypothetical protein HMPREF0758_0274 [Serratia odorifera DSM 4582]